MNIVGPTKKISCVGGGQLGRMMGLEAPRLNIEMTFLDSMGSDAPAASVTGCSVIKGSLKDPDSLRSLAEGCDVLTVEIEHVGVETLAALEAEGVNVQPSARVIGIIQDKLLQKNHFMKHSIPLPRFCDCPDSNAVKKAAEMFGLPLMLKSRKGGYDGRGNAVLKDLDSIDEALNSLAGHVYAEGWIDFECELAVMVVRSTTGEVKAYPTVTAIQKDSICRAVIAPARCSSEARKKAEHVASKAISSLGDGATGVFGVELFLCKDGSVLLNEVAPRPHNTGHYTQDACAISQFENHLRAISGLPIGDCSMNCGAAAMVNVLGAPSGDMTDTLVGINTSLTVPRAVAHWYGKQSCRAGRKMGHINLSSDSFGELIEPLSTILKLEGLDINSIISNEKRFPLVGVIMGSTSDLPCMNAAVEILDKFGVPYEVDVVSAHRTPDKLMSYSRSAAARGIQVIIAGAGGAAHLPGMVAAVTPLPVVGVPIKTSTMNGQDSLYSIVQMPRGIPVATVAIGNAMNAGLLAVRILASSRPELRDEMEAYQRGMKEMVDGTSEKLLEIGSKAYLEQMENKSTSVNV